MGSVASAVGSVAGALPGVGLLMGTGPLGSILGGPQGGSAGANVNQVDPNIAALQQQQLKQANDFRSNLGNYQSDQINSATDSNRLKTAQDVNTSNTNANSRGMLYGGAAQNAANNVAGSNQSALNSQIANINVNSQNQANQMDQSAINAGLVNQSLNQQYQNNVYNAAMGQQQGKATGINSLFQGAASLGGLLSGGGG